MRSIITSMLALSVLVSPVYGQAEVINQEEVPGEEQVGEEEQFTEDASDDTFFLYYTKEEEEYRESVVDKIYLGMPKAELISLINTEHTEEDNVVNWTSLGSSKRTSELAATFRDNKLIELIWDTYDSMWEIHLYALKTLALNISKLGIVVGEPPEQKFTQFTDRIPAKLGTVIGIEYTITDAKPDDTIELQISLSPPAGTPVSGEDAAYWERLNFSQEISISQLPLTGLQTFTFSQKSDLVPGEWKFVISFNQKEVAEKKFQVYIP